MGSSYTQLTQEQRYHIGSLLKIGVSKTQIAMEVGCHRSSIYKEINRNTGKRGYRPKQAQSFANSRKRKGNKQIRQFGWSYVEHLIKQYWSPEQISGGLTSNGWLDVISAESIYKYIYANKANGGDLHTYLRCQKTYRKRGAASQDRRGQIQNRVSIHERDFVIDERGRLGDFEGDTIIGKDHKGALLTLVDRVSKLTKIKPLASKNAENLANSGIQTLNASHTHSITFDNGKEFSKHILISQALNIDIFFADSYSSWQRGTNENTNGLIRQFFPKNLRLDDITEEQTRRVEYLLNNRPRKSLGFKTPFQVESRNKVVALGT
ncbi:IS30 family transposase [Francisellaceae bacterium CB300]